MYSKRSPPTLPAGMEFPYMSVRSRCGIAPSTGISRLRRYSSMLGSVPDSILELFTFGRVRLQIDFRTEEISRATWCGSTYASRIFCWGGALPDFFGDLGERVLFETARIGVELANAFGELLRRHGIFIVHPAERFLGKA